MFTIFLSLLKLDRTMLNKNILMMLFLLQVMIQILNAGRMMRGKGRIMDGDAMWGVCRQRRCLDELKETAKNTHIPSLPYTYSYNPVLKYEDWKEFTTEDFVKTLQCQKMQTRAIYDVSTWQYLQNVYDDVVGEKISSITYMKKVIEHGIVASKDMQAGEHILSEISMAQFYTKQDLNRFLAVLPTHLACDIILWTHDQDEDPFYFSVDLLMLVPTVMTVDLLKVTLSGNLV